MQAATGSEHSSRGKAVPVRIRTRIRREVTAVLRSVATLSEAEREHLKEGLRTRKTLRLRKPGEL